MFSDFFFLMVVSALVWNTVSTITFVWQIFYVTVEFNKLGIYKMKGNKG